MPDDTQAALEWIDYSSSLCGGCGLPKSETMDPANLGRYEAVPVQCFACAAKDAEQRQAQEQSDSYGKSAFDGVFIAVQERGGD